MDRRSYIKGTGAAVATGFLSGCLGEDGEPGTSDDADDDDGGDEGTQYGTLRTSVTDQPGDIEDFEELIVTIEGIWVKPHDLETDGGEEEGENGEDDDDDTDGENGGEEGTEESDDGEDGNGDDDEDGDDADEGQGRRYIELDEPAEANLVELQGSNTQEILEKDLPIGEYQFLQLDVSDARGTLNDGTEVDVETPGNAPLKFQESFEIRNEESTHFVADFTPVRRGQRNDYIIQPVASGTQVLYGDKEYQGGDDGDETGEDDAETDDDTGDTGGSEDGDDDADPGGQSPDDAGGGGSGPDGNDDNDDEDDTDNDDEDGGD